MAMEIIMPKAGMDMEEGTIIKWLKNQGDTVEVGEPLLEILTDKVNMEIEAEGSGILTNIIAQEGEVIPVFSVIGYLRKEGENLSIVTQSAKEILPPQIQEGYSKVRATPAARKLAKEKDLDLTNIVGSGPLGRIQKADIQEVNHIKATPLVKKIADVENIDLSSVIGTGTGGKIIKDDLNLESTLQKPHIKEAPSSKVANDAKTIPMVGLRKIIADRMIDSLRSTAPVTLDIEVDMTSALTLIEKVKDIVLEEIDKKITVTDIIIMAVTKGLMKNALVNATLVDEGIHINEGVNIGIAVGMEKGVLVPVIKRTDKMTLKEVVMNRTDIVEKTLSNGISPDELRGSTFTISNLGMFDIISFTSIINQPNSAIMSVGAISKRVRIINDQPQIRSIMKMSVTVDHRIIDGLNGAQFLQYVKKILEDTNLLLL